MSRAKRNFTALLLSQMATWVMQIVTLVVVPKVLGAETFGVLAFAMAFMGFFVLLANLGSNTFLVKAIAREPERLGAYAFNGVVMKLLLGTVVAGVAIAVARVVGYPSQAVWIVAAACTGLVIGSMTDVLAGVLQGTERMGSLALWLTFQQCAGGALALVLLLDHKGVIVYALVIGLSALIPFLAFSRQLWPETSGYRQLDLRLWRTIASGGMPFLLWSGILLVYGSIDILMLQRMTGSTTVGWYTLAYTWVGLPVFFASILSTVLLPSLTSKAISAPADFTATVNRAIRLVVLAGAPMATGIAVISADIIALFHYPASFDHAVPLIRILAAHIPLVGMDMVLGVAIQANDRQKAWVVVGCVAAVFNPLVNALAIPLAVRLYGNGAIGASVVTVATEIVVMFGALYLRPSGLLDGATVSFLLRTAVASALIVPAVLMVETAPLAVKVAVGVVAFAIASLLLRLTSVQKARASVSELIAAVTAPRGVTTPSDPALERV